MRINKFVALATGQSRRAADEAITQGRVTVNGEAAQAGQQVSDKSIVALDNKVIVLPERFTTLVFNKPPGYVTSRRGQGSQTIYDLLSAEYRALKPAGRLDKDSSGLLILTNDGELANRLTHPGHAKVKIYEIELDSPLQPLHQQMISDHGIQLEDGLSRLALNKLSDTGKRWQVTMSEGRNRQIRRTLAALGYTVTKLHRTSFGEYRLGRLPSGQWRLAG